MSAVRVINYRGQFTLGKRSAIMEGHLIDNAGFKYSHQHTFLFLPPGLCSSDRGSLNCSLKRALVRVRGDHSKNSFEGWLTPKAKVSVCFLQVSTASPERREGEGRGGRLITEPIRYPRARGHILRRWQGCSWQPGEMNWAHQPAVRLITKQSSLRQARPSQSFS